MTEQIDDIFDGDLGLRRGSDPIHDTRVAIRRLRSTLRVFGKLLDRAAIGDVDDELKWFAGLLGEVRDCQVQRRRFQDALAQFPRARARPGRQPDQHRPAFASSCRRAQVVAEAMESQRYLDLLATLQRWRTTRHCPAAEPKAAEKAGPPCRAKGRPAADRGDQVGRRRDAAPCAKSRQARPLRRRTTRAPRQACEENGQALQADSDGARRSPGRRRRIGTLRRLALTAGTTAGENGFTYGLLYAREQQAAEKARSAGRGNWSASAST